MRYKMLYVTAFGLTLGYLLTQAMHEDSSQSPQIAELTDEKAANTVEKFFTSIEDTLTAARENFIQFDALCKKIMFELDKRFFSPSLWVGFPQTLQAENSFYVQKITVSPQDIFFIFGDLHGDNSALLNALDKLVDDGVLTNQWEIEKHNHLIFLGDYVDRGESGVEVWYTLLTLLEANPDPSKIIVLRGNHENLEMNISFAEKKWENSYSNELRQKFALPPYEHTPATYYLLTNKLYNRLPSALYVTCNKDTFICAHGGLELGFNPKPLLEKNNAPLLFMAIKDLKRGAESKKLPTEIQSALNSSLGALFLQDIPLTDPYDLHFLWSDFNDVRDTKASERGAGWELGVVLTRALLERDNLCCMFRGHQHTAALMPELMVNKGFFAFKRFPVFTLMSFSDSLKQAVLCENYSYIKLAMGNTFNDWKAYHYFDEITEPITLQQGLSLSRASTPDLASSDLSDDAMIESLRAPAEDLSALPFESKPIQDGIVKKRRLNE